MPVLIMRSKCFFPGSSSVMACLPPAAEVMVPLIRMLSAVGGPAACKAAAFTVKLKRVLVSTAPQRIEK